MPVWGIVVAAGRGQRFGGAKQFAALDGVPLVERAVTTAAAVCD
ncbi:MAG: NTP transferase domain-containing protein, partial [Actinobacteria bacterium]|nr:NTP transferase domain-containing protein [Actinomycetota bacterium]